MDVDASVENTAQEQPVDVFSTLPCEHALELPTAVVQAAWGPTAPLAGVVVPVWADPTVLAAWWVDADEAWAWPPVADLVQLHSEWGVQWARRAPPSKAWLHDTLLPAVRDTAVARCLALRVAAREAGGEEGAEATAVNPPIADAAALSAFLRHRADAAWRDVMETLSGLTCVLESERSLVALRSQERQDAFMGMAFDCATVLQRAAPTVRHALASLASWDVIVALQCTHTWMRQVRQAVYLFVATWPHVAAMPMQGVNARSAFGTSMPPQGALRRSMERAATSARRVVDAPPAAVTVSLQPPLAANTMDTTGLTTLANAAWTEGGSPHRGVAGIISFPPRNNSRRALAPPPTAAAGTWVDVHARVLPHVPPDGVTITIPSDTRPAALSPGAAAAIAAAALAQQQRGGSLTVERAQEALDWSSQVLDTRQHPLLAAPVPPTGIILRASPAAVLRDVYVAWHTWLTCVVYTLLRVSTTSVAASNVAGTEWSSTLFCGDVSGVSAASSSSSSSSSGQGNTDTGGALPLTPPMPRGPPRLVRQAAGPPHTVRNGMSFQRRRQAHALLAAANTDSSAVAHAVPSLSDEDSSEHSEGESRLDARLDDLEANLDSLAASSTALRAASLANDMMAAVLAELHREAGFGVEQATTVVESSPPLWPATSDGSSGEDMLGAEIANLQEEARRMNERALTVLRQLRAATTQDDDAEQQEADEDDTDSKQA